MGKIDKQNRNERLRANKHEPEPGPFASVKRRMRFIKRTPARKIVIKNPERYLSAHARAMSVLRRIIASRS